MKIYTDGSGKGRFAYVIEDGPVRIEEEEGITSNEAEYKGVIIALRDLLYDEDLILPDATVVEFFLDSKIVVEQLTFKASVKADNLRVLANDIWQKVQNLRDRGVQCTFTWVPRKENLAGKVLG